MVEQLGHAVECCPEGACDARQTVAPTLVEEVSRPLPRSFHPRHSSLIGGVSVREDLGEVFLEPCLIDGDTGHGLEGLFHGVVAGAHLGEQLTCSPEPMLHVRGVDEPERIGSSEGEGQGVLADDTDAGRLDLDTALAVMAVGQQQVFVGHVITDDTDLSGQLGQQPDAFTLTKGTGRVVDSGMFTDDGVEKPEGLVILQGRVVLADDTEHRAVEGIVAHDGECIRHQEAIACDGGEDRSLADLPVEVGCLDGFLGGRRTLQARAEAMPGSFFDVEHGGPAIFDHEVV